MYSYKFEHPVWPTRLNVSEGFHQYSGELVIFLHGLGATADRWTANMEACAPLGLPSVAIDLPGHGFGVRDVSKLVSYEVLIDALSAVAENFGATRVHLVGTSLGGRIAAEYAVRNVDQVASLVLVGAAGFPGRSRSIPGVINRAKDTSRFGIHKKLLNLVFRQELVTEVWIEKDYRHNSGSEASAALARIADWFRGPLASPMSSETIDILRTLNPLLIWGRHDRSIPISVGHAASSVLESRILVYEHSAHAPYLEEAEAFNEDLRKFVSEHLAG